MARPAVFYSRADPNIDRLLADSGRGERDGGHGLSFGQVTMTIPDDGWKSTPLFRRSAAQKGSPRSADGDAPQADHLEFGLIVFLVLTATLFSIWLAVRGPAVLKRISSWRPICSLVSCETQAQPHREARAQPEPQSEPQPRPQALRQPQALSQPPAQHQTQPEPSRHPPQRR